MGRLLWVVWRASLAGQSGPRSAKSHQLETKLTRSIVRSALLIPYFTFSLFHVATYAQKTLVPKLLPSSFQSLVPPLKGFVEKYQQNALVAVAYYEVAIMPIAILVGLFPRWVRLLTPIIYAQFLLQPASEKIAAGREGGGRVG